MVPIGKAVMKRPGRDVTVVATHISLYRASAAAEELAGEGIECEVIDPLTLQPLDTETIFALGAQDRPAGDRPRGHPDRRLGRGGGGPGRRRVPVLPGGAGQKGGHVRRPHALRARPGERRAAKHGTA